MNIGEVQAMLAHIEAQDRRPFPEGAAEVWLEQFRNIDVADAQAAVAEYFRLNEKGQLLPASIRRRALEFRAARADRERRAIERRTREFTEPNAEYRQAIAGLARRVGDPQRLHRRPDTASPRLVGDEAAEFEAARQRALEALERQVA